MNGTGSRASSWLNWAQQPREAGGLGLAPHQAAGIVGNLTKESGDDLPSWGPTGDNRTAWGTAQWRNERLASLKQMYPDSYQTPEAQQAFMRHELDTTHNKAYQALQAAKTPEEAATAFNRLYEVSADNTGGREAAARQLMSQFGGDSSAQPDAPGALTTAFAPTENKSMPALSADSTLGPGALNSAQPQTGLFGLPTISDNSYDALMGMASSLAGISDPDHAKAIIAQQAANKKVAGDTGTWSIHTFPNGQSVLLNSKGQMKPLQGNYAAPKDDEYDKAAKVAGAKSNQDYGDNVAQQATNANGLAGDVAELRRVFSNPAVYQGQGGEWVQSARKLYAGVTGDTAGAQNIADGDIARALSNKLALKLVQDNGSGKLLPGSFSDSDRDFVKQMSTSLNNDAGANQRMLDMYDRVVSRAQQAEQARAAHLAANDGIYRPSVRSEIGALQKQWAVEDKARNEAEAKAAAAAPAAPKSGTAPKTNTFTSPSGKKINWSY
jgi:hypothetical protein